jgi:hypothetical protein
MKKLLMVALIALLSSPIGYVEARRSGGHSGSHGGHYRGGRGSSHKGGTYKNRRTGDRYQKHR